MRTSMSVTEFTRRNLLKFAALGAAGDLIVGVVYVGARDDFGWNQAHAVAIKSL